MTSQAREPALDPEACMGCGMCAWHCESPEPAIEILRLLESLVEWPGASS